MGIHRSITTFNSFFFASVPKSAGEMRDKEAGRGWFFSLEQVSASDTEGDSGINDIGKLEPTASSP